MAGRTIGNAASGGAGAGERRLRGLVPPSLVHRATLPVSGGLGASAASKTIGLPDARNRAVAGLATMGSTNPNRFAFLTIDGGKTDDTIGATAGASVIALTIDQMPAHNHGGAVQGGGSHSHEYRKGNSGSGVAGVGALTGGEIQVQTSTEPPHTHGIPSQGSGFGHLNVQPTILLTLYIKL